MTKKYSQEYYEKNKERIKAASQKYFETHKAEHENAMLKRNYGITLEDFKKMEADQGGVCKICGKPPTKNRKRLSVDHCHKTGKIRGLLCVNCNAMIGMAKDGPELLERGIQYLKENG